MPCGDEDGRPALPCANPAPPVAVRATPSLAGGEGAGRGRTQAQALIAAIAVGGFALAACVFYPGIMTFDSLFVHKAIAEGKVGDWQSPVMTAVWAVIDPIAPGPGSMFLLIAALYWLGFGLTGAAIARRAPRLGVGAALLGFAPPGFMFLGVIWRDMLFGGAWLAAAALAFAAAPGSPRVRLPAQAIALALIALGVMLRPNALIAAPILVAYALWPTAFRVKRAALAWLPAAVALFALIHLVYYVVLRAERQHPLHSLFVFDLGGITHFTKANQFPATWPLAEERRLVADCYDPYLWDAYWHGGKCPFVMGRIEKELGIFGTPALRDAWRRALLAHPVAYLEHRAAFMRTFLFGANYTIWTQDVNDMTRLALPDNRGFIAMLAAHDAIKPTPLFRVWFWLALNGAICAAAWRRRETDAGAFALAVAGSAALYVLTYAVVGVAADFRYAWQAVPAALAAGAAAAAARLRPE